MERLSTLTSHRLKLQWLLFLIHCLLLPLCSHGLTKTAFYGQPGLSIECPFDSLIRITSEKLGVGVPEEDTCKTSKGCAVDYNNVMWTCRGKGKCFNVPVEARALPDPSCGSAYTTCLKVEYDCVASKYILHDRKK